MLSILDNLFDLLLIGIIFLILDGIWFFIMKDIFAKLIYNIQNKKIEIKIIPAIITYIIMTCGFYYFIINNKNNIIDAILLGFFVYGIYEFTNLSIFDNWSVEIVIMDILWGGFLFGITSKILSLKQNLFYNYY
jgi:uncharacterized membrane protein